MMYIFQKAIWLLFLVIIGYLFIASIFSTCYLGAIQYSTLAGDIEFNWEHTFYMDDNPIPHIIVFLLFSCFLLILGKRKDSILKLSKAVGVGALCISVLIAGYIVLAGQYYPSTDQQHVIEDAAAFMAGDFTDLKPGGYVYLWPFQIGVIVYYWILSYLFGSLNITAFQLVNILLIVFSYILLAKILGRLTGENKKLGNAALIAAALFLPYLFYAVFLYGNVVGLFFALAACYFAILYLKNYKWYLPLLGGFCMAAAVFVKSNYLIFYIGIVIYIGGSVIKNVGKNKKTVYAGIIFTVIMSVCCWLESVGSMRFLTYLNDGEPIDGTPMVAWVAMGLEDGKAAPGWYNGFNNRVYTESYYDYEMAKEISNTQIVHFFKNASTNMKATVGFFVKKIASQWNNPTFSSLRILDRSYGTNSLDWLLYGERARAIYIGFVNLVQTWILAGGLLYAVLRIRKSSWEEILLPLIFIGGFTFHLFWEADNIYAVPYFLLLLPLGVWGYREWYFVLLKRKAYRKKIALVCFCGILICAVSGTDIFAKFFARKDDEGVFNRYTQEPVVQDQLSVGFEEFLQERQIAVNR